MINPTDHKEPIKLITADQHNESQMINPTDHRESTQPITTNQLNGSQTINPTNHNILNLYFIFFYLFHFFSKQFAITQAKNTFIHVLSKDIDFHIFRISDKCKT